MQSGYTGHVTPSEWRWVIWLSVGLIVLAFIPFLWIILVGVSDTRWEFMGILHNYENGASHLAKVFQGTQGRWLTQFLLTPEPHIGTLFDSIYAVIGQSSRLILLPGVVLFHIARVAASLFMYLAIYQLAACVWSRVRTRRIFFLIVVFTAGFGWIAGVLTEDPTYLDLTAPEVFPFLSTLVNVHFPLSIGGLALLVSIIIPIFRPGSMNYPSVYNEGIVILGIALLLSFVYPQALLPIMLAFIVVILMNWRLRKQLMLREWRWLLWFIVPTLPILVYYGAVLNFREVIAEIWAQQNSISSPYLHVFLLSLGLPLILAVPGIWRAIRRFEPDGDQFMLVWLLVMVIMMYFTPAIQRRFGIGLMIPIGYFGTRAIEDLWFKFIARRWRYRLMVAGLPIAGASLLFVLFLPIFPVLNDDFDEASGMLLQSDYAQTFRWLRERGGSNGIVLAAPETSTWIPAVTGFRVVYGHPADSIQPAIKRRAVNDWYALQNIAECEDLLVGRVTFSESYLVRYIIIGPQERTLGDTVCVELLEPLETFGSVTLYLYTPNTIIIP